VHSNRRHINILGRERLRKLVRHDSILIEVGIERPDAAPFGVCAPDLIVGHPPLGTNICKLELRDPLGTTHSSLRRDGGEPALSP
jgi:hypothetical protein